MIEEKSYVFILENEKPAPENPDVSPYRCAYCGELANVERDDSEVPVSVGCNCEDAIAEIELKRSISEMENGLYETQLSLTKHYEEKAFDEDTRLMRYEDELTNLKRKYNVT